jgi:hypothetical protein
MKTRLFFRTGNCKSLCKTNRVLRQALFAIFLLFTLPLFAQTGAAGLAPGAGNQLAELLNKPAAVKPATATPAAALGKSWFNVELDHHCFTDQAGFKQIVAVLLNIEGQENNSGGKKTKLKAVIASRENDRIIADFESVTQGPLGIQFTTTYRAAVKILENTDTKFICETRQIPRDSETNNKMKNLYSIS